MAVGEKQPSSRPSLLWPCLVWLVRIIAGGVFVASGLAKSIDPWGSVYKIGEYFAAWGWAVPRTLTVTGAMALGMVEFVLGGVTLLGCYRRTAVWGLLLLMMVMLPLTAYIAIFEPVADCGCFGDMLVLGNFETFVKNVILTGLLAFLAFKNATVRGLFSPHLQWVVVTLLGVYIFAIVLYGYNVQPLVDFRRFPVGSELLAQEDDEDGGVEYEFVYEDAQGIRKTFSQDALPEDDGWTFLERRLVSGKEHTDDGFVVTDSVGDDIAPDIIDTQGQQIIVAIPDLPRMDISHTYAINELAERAARRGESLVTLIAGGEEAVHRYKDISMAQYPVYAAEPTLIKELVRGNPGVVYLRAGTIVAKHTLESEDYPLSFTTLSGHALLWTLSCALLAALAILALLDNTWVVMARALKRRKKITRNV